MIREGSGPPLLLLHGFLGAASAWRPVIERLAARFELIAPDWPGFGDSLERRPLESIASMADYVASLLDRFDLERAHVLGYSMSGFVAQELLLRHPSRVDKAVLYGAGLTTSRAGRFETLARTIERLRHDGVGATAQRVCATWFVDGDSDDGYPECVDVGRRMDVEAGVAALSACEGIDYSGRLAGVAHSVLVMAGDRDRTFGWSDIQALAMALPGSDLCVLPHCAHGAHLEAPQLFCAALERFLARPRLRAP